jgi:hypothetical protein
MQECTRKGNSFSCMWSGGCKAVFAFWYSDFAKGECNMGGDGLLQVLPRNW